MQRDRIPLLIAFALTQPTAAATAAGDIRIRWQHLTSRNGYLPVPGASTHKIGALVADVDRDDLNDFITRPVTQGPEADRA
jgi:hypothetical protein